MVLLLAKQHQERELGLCTSRQKSVCVMCRVFGESESECIRESSEKCGGQEIAGLPEDRKRKWCKLAKRLRKLSAVVGVWWVGWGGQCCRVWYPAAAPSFFIINRVKCIKGCVTIFLPPPSHLVVCARALARLARTKLLRLLYKESYIFLLVRCLLVFYCVVKRVGHRCNNVLCFYKNNAFVVWT